MLRHAAALLYVTLLAQGCATITSGTTHSMAVATEPAGAVCELRRDGQVIAVVNPTPGTATFSKSSRPLSVDCTRNGAQPAATVVQPEFQVMTLGNVLVGGLIGIAVDAASGAMGTYPTNVRLVLAPERFDSAAQRDAFFQARAAEIRSAFAERAAAVRRDCTPGAPAACDGQVQAVERERDAALARLEEQRLRGATTGT